MSKELKVHTHIDYSLHDLVNMRFYLAADVDALLAEKDAEIKRLESACRAFATERDANQDAIYELRKEIESLKASHYAESVDAGMRERRLRRELWLARAQRANEHYHRYHGKFLCPLEDIPEYVKWKQVERKCRAKAEGYK